MKVLFITRKYPPRVGGMESLSYQLTTGFPEPKTIVPLRRSQKHLFWFLPYAVGRAALGAVRHDIVHLGDALLGAVGLVPRFLLGRPVAVTVHGLDLTYRSQLYQWYLRRFLRASMYIAVSESTRRIAEERGLAPVTVIANGVADVFFALERDAAADPELAALRAGRVVLTTVGRLVRRKGVEWFVRDVLPSFPNTVYVVVGTGPERQAIERACHEVGVRDRVLLLGGVSEARLHGILRAADVFVMPNIAVPGDVEGFGIVAIEAAASGLPVVAARVDGIPDAICDGENGVLALAGDAAAFTTALAPLTADADLRRQTGERARRYTRRVNGWDAILAKHQEVFASVIGRKRRVKGRFLAGLRS